MKTHRYAEALPFAEKALSLHRELGDRSEEYNALNVLGIIMGWLGRPGEAKEYLCQSLEIAEAIGSRQGISSVVSNMVWMHFCWQGEYEAALAFLEEQLAKARLANDEYLVGMLRGENTRLLYFLGRFAPALNMIQALRPTIETLMDQMEQVKYLVLTGMIQAELEDYAGARQHLGMALERAERAERALETASILTNQAYVVLLEGGDEEYLRLGLEQAMQSVKLLTGTEWMLELAHALDTAAQLHLALGQVEEATARSTEAMRLVATWPFVPEEYVFTHSRALRAAGREAEADDYLRRAYERVMLVADKTHDESLHRSWLENVRINREIVAHWATRGKA
jgi:tetratricopeptide (TPR) repeat protein